MMTMSFPEDRGGGTEAAELSRLVWHRGQGQAGLKSEARVAEVEGPWKGNARILEASVCACC